MRGTGNPVSVDLRYLRQRERAKPQGIGRFVDGRFGLDRIIAATLAEPEALSEIGRARVERLHADRDAERRRVKETKR